MTGTLVLGLGNLLRGDDGVGPAVIAELRRRGVPDAVTLLDGGTPGLTMPLLWEGFERVILVDAAQMEGEPAMGAGDWRRFEPSGVALSAGAVNAGTLHGAGLAEAITLARLLDLLPERLVMYTVQTAGATWGEGLSPEVAHSVPAICDGILQELTT